MLKSKNICHFTSVHNRNDSRIFHKQCSSLSKIFNTYLVVCDGNGNEFINGIEIIDAGYVKNRFQRIFVASIKLFIVLIKLKVDIYHFHDPELLFLGYILKKMGKKVIYDVHEDMPRVILNKYYLSKNIRKYISKMYEIVENILSSKFDIIITATPYIKKRFEKINHNTFCINNYPIIFEINLDQESKNNEICYVGVITEIRGITELVKSMKYVNCRLNLAGNYVPLSYKEYLSELEGWEKVNDYGYVNNIKIREILSKSKVGLVILRPIDNYLESLPIKMFEYMCSGIPVIASSFPLWKEIIYKANCGICVDPLNTEEISNAINYLIENESIAKQMGINGRNAVLNEYNWLLEESKLLKIYSKIEK